MIELSNIPNLPRNQSPEHAELAARSLCWFAARSTGRGIVGATEIEVAQGYVADAVAIGGFQMRFLDTYLSRSGLREKYTIPRADGEPVIAGDVYNEFACIFEVKVTRPDFDSTFGAGDKHANRHKPVGSMHWCVTPKGMVLPARLPDFWGLLEASGRGLTEVRTPRVFVINESVIHKFGYRIVTRGDYRAATWQHIPVCPVCLTEKAKAAGT